ncbi:hypothetical protein GGS20DRAFT_556522 [Poronia punctata]|nr:hypothetical protein GGS20DRAFT_556522 [Poronia punctata]
MFFALSLSLSLCPFLYLFCPVLSSRRRRSSRKREGKGEIIGEFELQKFQSSDKVYQTDRSNQIKMYVKKTEE